jgi:4-hydroxybenzoate polyprenyltransferase
MSSSTPDRPVSERAPQLSPVAAHDSAGAESSATLAVHGEIPQHRPSLLGHLRIARVDHWVKNVFVLPGVVAAIALIPESATPALPLRLLLGLLSVGLVASSNYTINEVIDAPFDRHHPSKRQRPVPSGQVSIPLAYVQWLVLAAAGLAIGWKLGAAFLWTMAALWVMGVVYNVRPLRTKDVPYLDVLSEAVNNPLRMMAGWFLATEARVVPATLLLSYWMVGCYFMAIKRYAEVRQIGQRDTVAAYRRSLAWFTPEKLLVAITFYGSAAMLFFGAFIMRYRLELILSFPFVALVMAQYLGLGFRDDSAAQNPERLYREPGLMVSVVLCSLVMGVLLFLDLPVLYTIVSPDFLPSLRR